MKIKYLCGLLICFHLSTPRILIAQKNRIFGTVVYTFIHSKDKLRSFVDSTFDVSEGRLIFSQSAWKCVSWVETDSKIGVMNEMQPGQYSQKLKMKDPIGQIQYASIDKDSLYSRSTYFKREIITGEKLPKIDWKIFEAYKTVSSLVCQKAVGNFRGRTYTAWFSLRIPVSAGPWKLCGLPGLILEAYDSAKQVQFLLKNLLYPSPAVATQIVPGMDFSKKVSVCDAIEERLKAVNNLRAIAMGNVPEGAEIGQPKIDNSQSLERTCQ